MKKIGEMLLNTRLLLQEIQKLQPGDSLSYAQLSNFIGKNIREPRYRGSLTSARHIAFRQSSIVTVCIRNEGVLRPLHEDVPQLGRQRYEHINRQARQGRREQETINLSGLSNDARVAQLTCLSLLGALEQATRRRVVSNIRRLVNQSMPSHLTLSQTLEAFKIGHGETHAE